MLLLFAVWVAAAATLDSQIAPQETLVAYAQSLWEDAVAAEGHTQVTEAPEGAGILGVLSGAAAVSGGLRGLLIGFEPCDAGLCYAGHVTLMNLQTQDPTALKVYAPVDLGAPGPLTLAPAEASAPTVQAIPALPVVSRHSERGRTSERLTLVDLRGGAIRPLFQHEIWSRTEAGRRSTASALQILAEGEGDLPAIEMTWLVRPGIGEHDARCRIPERTRRFDFDGHSYREFDPGFDTCD